MPKTIRCCRDMRESLNDGKRCTFKYRPCKTILCGQPSEGRLEPDAYGSLVGGGTDTLRKGRRGATQSHRVIVWQPEWRLGNEIGPRKREGTISGQVERGQKLAVAERGDFGFGHTASPQGGEFGTGCRNQRGGGHEFEYGGLFTPLQRREFD